MAKAAIVITQHTKNNPFGVTEADAESIDEVV